MHIKYWKLNIAHYINTCFQSPY